MLSPFDNIDNPKNDKVEFVFYFIIAVLIGAALVWPQKIREMEKMAVSLSESIVGYLSPSMRKKIDQIKSSPPSERSELARKYMREHHSVVGVGLLFIGMLFFINSFKLYRKRKSTFGENTPRKLLVLPIVRMGASIALLIGGVGFAKLPTPF